jgi:hypothetical protein
MTATYKSHSPGLNGHTGGRGPVGGLRRRVTDIPREVEEWFTGHSRYGRTRARELARAELTAQRDGYVIRWVHPWICQLLEPGDEEVAIATAHNVMLEGGPDADPRARKVERQLARTAGRDAPDGPGCVVCWEHVWVCQLLEPGGETVIGESGGWAVDPAANPVARWIAAELALGAGI